MNLLESASFFDEALILEMPKSITALRARPTESNVWMSIYFRLYVRVRKFVLHTGVSIFCLTVHMNSLSSHFRCLGFFFFFFSAFNVYCLYKYVKQSFSSKASVYCRPKRQNFFFRLLFWTKISISNRSFGCFSVKNRWTCPKRYAFSNRKS